MANTATSQQQAMGFDYALPGCRPLGNPCRAEMGLPFGFPAGLGTQEAASQALLALPRGQRRLQLR